MNVLSALLDRANPPSVNEFYPIRLPKGHCNSSSFFSLMHQYFSSYISSLSLFIHAIFSFIKAKENKQKQNCFLIVSPDYHFIHFFHLQQNSSQKWYRLMSLIPLLPFSLESSLFTFFFLALSIITILVYAFNDCPPAYTSSQTSLYWMQQHLWT